MVTTSPVRRAVPGRLLPGAALGCVGIVVILAVLVQLGSDPMHGLDRAVGTRAHAWSVGSAGSVEVLLVIEALFGTVGTVAYVLVLIGALWRAGHRRAVCYTAIVMAGASFTTTVLKTTIRRDRPLWDDPVHALSTFSFPSGHASGVASGMGVVTVMAMLHVGRRAVRVAVFAVAASLVVVVGADRILLGVHHLSDVVAGYAVGASWILVVLVLYPPRRVSVG